MTPNKKTARLAGLCFLLMVVFGLFAELFFRQKLFVPNDAAATASNILSNVFLFRTGIVSDILMSVFYLLTALVLFRLFSSVDKSLASLMVVFAAAGSVLLLFTVLFECAPLYVLSENLSSDPDKTVTLFYSLYQHGYMVGQIFFALWVLPLGLLIVRSGFTPKVIGVLFVIETVCGLLAVLVHFLAPSQAMESVLLIPGILAEFAFMFWLLIRGVGKTKVPLPARAYGNE